MNEKDIKKKLDSISRQINRLVDDIRKDNPEYSVFINNNTFMVLTKSDFSVHDTSDDYTLCSSSVIVKLDHGDF